MNRDSAVESLWWATRPGVGVRLLRAFLVPFSFMVSWLARVRAWGYRRGTLTAFRAPCPVIAVGNLTVGGTGKTPFVRRVATWLVRHGYRPVVLQRGYGAEIPGRGIDEEGASLEASVPGLRVIRSTELRAGGGDWSFATAPRVVVLLDDAFQRQSVRRDLNVLLVDASRPFGNGWTLPAGPLRESVGSAARADLIVVTRADAHPEAASDVVRRMRSAAPRSTVLLARHAPTILVRSGASPDSLRSRKVWLLSAVGNPAAFESTVAGLGADILGHTVFADHADPPLVAWTAAAKRARSAGADLLLTTGKDAPKIPDATFELPVDALEVQVEPIGDADAFDRLIATAVARERAT